MTSNDLIKKLSADLTPVQVIKYGIRDYFIIFTGALFSAMAGLALSGVRFDLQNVMLTKRFIFESLVLLILAILSTVSALQMSIPNLQTQATKKIVLATLSLWFMSLLYFTFNTKAPIAGWGFRCAENVIFNSLFPAIVIFLIIRKAASLNRSFVGWLILTSATSYGALIAQFSCSKTDHPLHLLVWHALPVLLVGFIGLVLGKIILKKM